MASHVVSHFYQISLPASIALQTLQIPPAWSGAEAALRRDSSAQNLASPMSPLPPNHQESQFEQVQGMSDGDVVAKKSPHPLEYTYFPQVIDQYARSTSDPLPAHLAMFCFPQSISLKESESRPGPIKHHSFVLTKEDGTKMYGACIMLYEMPQGALRRQLMYLCRSWYLKNINKSDIEYLGYIRQQIDQQKSIIQELTARVQQLTEHQLLISKQPLPTHLASSSSSSLEHNSFSFPPSVPPPTQNGRASLSQNDNIDELNEHLQAAEDTFKLFANLLRPFLTNACVEPSNLWVPRAIGLLSYWPFYSFMEDWLKCVVDDLDSSRTGRHIVPLESYIVNLFHELPFPPLGRKEVCLSMGSNLLYLHRPPPNDITLIKNFSFFPLFRSLPIEKVLQIVEAALAEKKIIFVSQNLAILTNACETITTLMFPFYWFHIFIPVLPATLTTYLQAPVPFIVGIHKGDMPPVSELEDTLVIDLDENKITSNLLTPPLPLPQRQKSKLLNRLRSFCKLPAIGVPLECVETYPLGRVLLRSSRSVVVKRDSYSNGMSPSPSNTTFFNQDKAWDISPTLTPNGHIHQPNSPMSLHSMLSNESITTVTNIRVANAPSNLSNTSRLTSLSLSESTKPPHVLHQQQGRYPHVRNSSIPQLQLLPPSTTTKRLNALSALANSITGGTTSTSSNDTNTATNLSTPTKQPSLSVKIFSSTSSIRTSSGNSLMSTAAANMIKSRKMIEGHNLVEMRGNSSTTSPDDTHSHDYARSPGRTHMNNTNGGIEPPTPTVNGSRTELEMPCNVCSTLSREMTWRCSDCDFHVHEGCIDAVCFPCPTTFNEGKIRTSFFRMFVGLLKTYATHLSSARPSEEDYFDVDSVFAKKKFIDSCEFENRAFLTAFLDTQAFAQFIMERVRTDNNKDNDYELLLFDESIKDKASRSRLTFRRDTSTFLKDTTSDVKMTYDCVAPWVPTMIHDDGSTSHDTTTSIGTLFAPSTLEQTEQTSMADIPVRRFPVLRASVLAAVPRRETRSLTTPQEEILMTVHAAKMARQARMRSERARRADANNSSNWWSRKQPSYNATPSPREIDTTILADIPLGDSSLNEQKRERIEEKIQEAMDLLKEPEVTSQAKTREEYRDVIQRLSFHASALKELILTADPKKSDLDDIILLTSQLDKLRELFELEMADIFVDDFDMIVKPKPVLDVNIDVGLDFSMEFDTFNQSRRGKELIPRAAVTENDEQVNNEVIAKKDNHVIKKTALGGMSKDEMSKVASYAALSGQDDALKNTKDHKMQSPEKNKNMIASTSNITNDSVKLTNDNTQPTIKSIENDGLSRMQLFDEAMNALLLAAKGSNEESLFNDTKKTETVISTNPIKIDTNDETSSINLSSSNILARRLQHSGSSKSHMTNSNSFSGHDVENKSMTPGALSKIMMPTEDSYSGNGILPAGLNGATTLATMPSTSTVNSVLTS